MLRIVNSSKIAPFFPSNYIVTYVDELISPPIESPNKRAQLLGGLQHSSELPPYPSGI